MSSVTLGIYEKALRGANDWRAFFAQVVEGGFTFMDLSIDETPERMALAKRAIEALLATLSPGDTVTLLTCSDKTRKIFTLSGWNQPETAKRADDELAAIRCQGATNLEDGIVRAFESASALATCRVSYWPCRSCRLVVRSVTSWSASFSAC